MKVTRTDIPDVILLEPRVHQDARGFFLESYNRRTLHEATGLQPDFVQDNTAFSVRNVLRGLHYQIRQPQGKLVRVVAGAVFDAIVDLRRSSPTFGQWFGLELSAANKRMLWVPEGFAHGFLTLQDGTDFLYKCTAAYAPEHEHSLAWNDPSLAIDWPLDGAPSLSAKDASGAALSELPAFP